MSENEPTEYRLGVGVLLLNDDNQVFVGRRMDQEIEAWQMPQGGIDADEFPSEAAFRELQEETGVGKAAIIAESEGWFIYDLPPELRGKAWKGRYRGQKQKWFAMRFLGQDSDIDLHTHHPEFDAWQWIEPVRLLELIVPFKRDLYREIIAEFAFLWERNKPSDESRE